MSFYDKLQALDRRWIYLVVAIAITVPLMLSFNSKTYTTEPTENLYRLIDSYSNREDRALLLEFNHDSSAMPELFPMEVSILRHCFERKIKIFNLAFSPEAAAIAVQAINTAKEDFPQVQSGIDYINFGYVPASLYLQVMLGFGDDIAQTLTVDADGRKVVDLPMMKGIKNYNEMNLAIEVSASSSGSGWYTYARPRFGVNVATGVTAVMAADCYPYLQTGQLIGMLGGLKGAAEYEKMVDTFAAWHNPNLKPGEVDGRPFNKELLEQSLKENTFRISDQTNYKYKTARIGMNAQSVAHIMMIIFILIGNIGYFMQKRAKKRLEEQQG